MIFMRIGTYFAIYFLIWWIVLFAVLPWGVRNQEEAARWCRAPIRARRRCTGCGASSAGRR